MATTRCLIVRSALLEGMRQPETKQPEQAGCKRQEICVWRGVVIHPRSYSHAGLAITCQHPPGEKKMSLEFLDRYLDSPKT